MWSSAKVKEHEQMHEHEPDVAEACGGSDKNKSKEFDECKCNASSLELDVENNGCMQKHDKINKFATNNSKNEWRQNIVDKIDGQGKTVDYEDEPADSGFISGLNTSSSLLLSEEITDNKTNKNPAKQQQKQQQQQQQQKPDQKKKKLQQESKTFLDSGCIEADDNFDDDNEENSYADDDDDDTNDKAAAEIIAAAVGVDNEAKTESDVSTVAKHQSLEEHNNIPKVILTQTDQMRFKNNVDSGITERFCSLSLQSGNGNGGIAINNLNATRNRSNTAPLLFEGITAEQQQQILRQQSLPTSSQQQKLLNKSAPQSNWEEFYQQNSDGDTPLHLACLAGAEDVVAALLRIAIHPCLYNIQNDDAQTPLHMAALSAHPKILRMLLVMGAQPSIRDRHGNTALHLAVNSGEVECVRALLLPITPVEVQEGLRSYAPRTADKKLLFNISNLRLPLDLEIRNYNGERCVHLAAQIGRIDILRLLVTYGADINAREGKSGQTPLHIAIENCNVDLVNFLLDECQSKLNLETATYAGLTAYQVACLLDKEQLQCILEKRGAEPLTPPDSDYDNSDSEDIDDSKIFGDPNYFVNSYNGPNAMRVA